MNDTLCIAKADSLRSTITLINNQEDIICTDPVYYVRTGTWRSGGVLRSCIVAQPRSDLRFEGICYVELKSGRRPVVVKLQRDGGIRLEGAYVDLIASELELDSIPPSNGGPARNEDWMRAMDDGWQSRGETLPETAINKGAQGVNEDGVAVDA